MRRAVFAIAALLWTASSFAQDYPNRPIRIIVPTPAGGPVDVMARVLANALPAARGMCSLKTNLAPATPSDLVKPQRPIPMDTLMVSAAAVIMSPMIVKERRLRRFELRAGRSSPKPRRSWSSIQSCHSNLWPIVAFAKAQSRQAQLFDRRHRHAASSQCRAISSQ